MADSVGHKLVIPFVGRVLRVDIAWTRYIPLELDARWGVELEMENRDDRLPFGEVGAHVVIGIHSPSRTFLVEPVGQRFRFHLHVSRTADGLQFYHLEAEPLDETDSA